MRILFHALLLVFSSSSFVDSFSLQPRKENSQSKAPRTLQWMSSQNDDSLASTSFSSELIKALDLDPLIQRVARHCGTRRGRQALLDLVHPQERKQETRIRFETSGPSAKRRRVSQEAYRQTPYKRKNFRFGVAQSAEESRQEYELVEQAILALEGPYNLTFPPLYGAESGPFDIDSTAETDYDEWLDLPTDEWTLEQILHAEQVACMLLNVQEWGNREEQSTWTPLLTDIATCIDHGALESLYEDIVDAVEIVRVRSVTDPNARSTFSFRLSGSKYSILAILRQKKDELQERIRKEPHLERKLAALEEELVTKENDIEQGLVQSILSHAEAFDSGLNAIAQLDVVFARAAFGIQLHGSIPSIHQSEGRIDVKHFVHPLLADGTKTRAVPIDLHLSPDKGERALIISGMNGGGKTLAMKSFGLVSILCKLGIPIPGVKGQEFKPRVDFFDDILTSVGDHQNVVEGQSTFMSQLHTYSDLIEEVSTQNNLWLTETRLILLDELGSGTEANAGGAIAQAIVEKLLETKSCRIVATTHSPRLKALSFDSDEFGCATVLLKKDTDSEFQLPTYELKYGLIGESYALDATSRCSPSLPMDVLTRASELIAADESSGSISGDYIQALVKSLEKHVDMSTESRLDAETHASNTVRCQTAMMCLASAYDRHLAMLEDRAERCFQDLKEKGDSLELLGKTLAELRTVRKQIKSEKELLQERGLKLLPNSYSLSEGESVVIVDGAEWDGTTAKVVALDVFQQEDLGPDDVAVLPSLNPWDDMISGEPAADSMSGRPMIFKRYQIAIWDFDSVWEEADMKDMPVTSIADSKRRLNSILSSIEATPAKRRPADDGKNMRGPFSSSRERKTARKNQKRKRKK